MPHFSPIDRRFRESTSPRRGFLGQLLGGAAAAALGAMSGAPLAAQSPARPTASPRGDTLPPSPTPRDGDTFFPEPRGGWDMSWTEKITGRHRQVFDAPEVAEGTALHQARMFLAGYEEVYGAKGADVNAVLVFRHRAVPVVLDDAMWAKYPVLARRSGKLKDPTTGKSARRNPFLGAKPGDKYALVWPDGGLDTLIGKGAIVLVCNVALMALAGVIAKDTKQTQSAVADELKGALVPGVIRMPSGVFAVTRAEEAGCHYIRGT
ncbi:MAG TPA: hypothetical protein VFS44_12330 [Gemmatimonadaceae bacterium]|nr:hypothetical protein [Gemmatimonadaceae bacterium]